MGREGDRHKVGSLCYFVYLNIANKDEKKYIKYTFFILYPKSIPFMEFEFDEQKSASNKAKHGINFIEAQELWLDTKRVEREHPDFE